MSYYSDKLLCFGSVKRAVYQKKTQNQINEWHAEVYLFTEVYIHIKYLRGCLYKKNHPIKMRRLTWARTWQNPISHLI